jgi:N6-adenosine-specific RNA methylase IME4
MEPFRTIVADPPWPFRDALPGPKRGAVTHYRLMSLKEICNFPLPPVADDSRLFLWRVASQQEEALQVVRAWGFEVKAEIVWVKTNFPMRRLTIGMGHQVRMSHEVCLVCTRGKPKRLSKSIPSVYFAPRRRHSEKPPEFYKLIQSLSPGPYLELFARFKPPGWFAMGDELPEGESLSEVT